MSLRARSLTHTLAAALCALALGCGARTGLRVPDASTDVAPPRDVIVPRDVPVVFDACVPGAFQLVHRPAEIIVLLDRSDSMQSPLDARFPLDVSRFRALTEALGATLPAFTSTLAMGALLFPNAGECRVRGPLDVAIETGTATRIVDTYRRRATEVGTPTADAVAAALGVFRSRGAPLASRYLVLATDGGPACNTSLDPATCECLFPSMGGCEPRFCLDDRRTLDAIGAARDEGVPTFVIGIDDPAETTLTATLERMAQSGGRPRATRPSYYSVRRREDLTGAFEAIQRSITRCVFVSPSRPDDPDAIAIELDGAGIPRDTSRTEGWDWTARDLTELTLFGRACDRATLASTLIARVTCRAP